jgi:hypothetical protein
VPAAALLRDGAGPLPEPVAAAPAQGGAPARRAIRWTHPVGAAAAILVILAVLAGLLTGPKASNPAALNDRGADAGAGRLAEQIASLPARVFYILGDGIGGVRVAGGSGVHPRGLDVGGLATRMALSPDGSTIAVIRKDGSLRVLPGSFDLPGPVRDVALPQDGSAVAVCSGRDPHMVVATVGGAVVWSGPASPSCTPSWSPNGRFVGFTARSAGQGRPARTRIVDMNGGKVLDLPRAGPIAWGPPEAGSEHVTAISQDCRSIVSVDVVTGASERIAQIPGMSGLRTKWGSSCPVTAMAWSPVVGPAWLAVAIRGDDANPGRVLVFAVVSRHAFEVTSARGLVATSLSWSSDGPKLLVDGAERSGMPIAVLADAPRAWLGDRISLASASWSPDGRWILGRQADGWVAYDADDAGQTVGLSVPNSAVDAIWCCPPAPSYPAWPSS